MQSGRTWFSPEISLVPRPVQVCANEPRVGCERADGTGAPAGTAGPRSLDVKIVYPTHGPAAVVWIRRSWHRSLALGSSGSLVAESGSAVCVADGAPGGHCNIPFTAPGDLSPVATLVDASTDFAGESGRRGVALKTNPAPRTLRIKGASFAPSTLRRSRPI